MELSDFCEEVLNEEIYGFYLTIDELPGADGTNTNYKNLIELDGIWISWTFTEICGDGITSGTE